MDHFKEQLQQRLFVESIRGKGSESEAADYLLALAHKAGAGKFDWKGTAKYIIQHFHTTAGLLPEKIASYSLADLAAMFPAAEPKDPPSGQPPKRRSVKCDEMMAAMLLDDNSRIN